MGDKCGFCLVKLKRDEGTNVKELMIDTNSRIVRFTDVLFDLFHCEIDVSKICPSCMDAVNKQYLFKENLKKVIKMPSQKNADILRKVQSFLSKSEDKMQVTDHLGILSIFPESRNSLMRSIKFFNPGIDILQIKPTQAQNTRQNSPFRNLNGKLAAESDDYKDHDNRIYKAEQKKACGSSRGRPPKKPKLSGKEKNCDKKSTYCIKTEHEQESIDIRLDSTRLTRGIDYEQRQWLANCMVSTTRNKSRSYVCKFCSKFLNSYRAITYHYIHLHYLKNLPSSKFWISCKVREGKRTSKAKNGEDHIIFQCTECTKVYNNQPGLRYHLSQHLQNDFNDDGNLSDKEDE